MMYWSILLFPLALFTCQIHQNLIGTKDPCDLKLRQPSQDGDVMSVRIFDKCVCVCLFTRHVKGVTASIFDYYQYRGEINSSIRYISTIGRIRWKKKFLKAEDTHDKEKLKEKFYHRDTITSLRFIISLIAHF